MPTKAIVPNHKAVITHARFSLMVLILSLTHPNNTGILAYLRFKEREVVHLPLVM